MLIYKVDVIDLLNQAGHNITYAKYHNGISQSAFSYIKNGKMVGTKMLDQICGVLQCQPGDLIEWIPDKPED